MTVKVFVVVERSESCVVEKPLIGVFTRKEQALEKIQNILGRHNLDLNENSFAGFSESYFDIKEVEVVNDPDALLRRTPLEGMNAAQEASILKKYKQNSDGAASYDEFRNRANADTIMGCVMLPWCGMWVGIEKDGYTHT